MFSGLWEHCLWPDLHISRVSSCSKLVLLLFPSLSLGSIIKQCQIICQPEACNFRTTRVTVPLTMSVGMELCHSLNFLLHSNQNHSTGLLHSLLLPSTLSGCKPLRAKTAFLPLGVTWMLREGDWKGCVTGGAPALQQRCASYSDSICRGHIEDRCCSHFSRCVLRSSIPNLQDV